MTFKVKPIGKRCVNGKQKFRTQADASMYAANFAAPTRAYHCPECDFWHLSSKPALVAVDALLEVGPRVMQRVVTEWQSNPPQGDPYELALRAAIDAARERTGS